MAAVTGPVIDLGELRHEPEQAPLPRPPRARDRPLRCALALLLVLATMAAGAPPARRSVVTLPARLGTDALVAGDLFLVIDPISPQARQRRLVAFRLPGGEPAWQVPLPMDGRFWGISQQGGMLLVTGHQATPGGGGTLTVALDQATGAYRWQQPGSATELADGSLLLESVDGDEPGSLRAVDPCCGTVRWQLRTAPGEISYHQTGRGVDRVVLSRTDGWTEIRDATTGAVLVRRDLRAAHARAFGTVQVVGDLLLAVGGVPATITAYGLDRLDRRWSTGADGLLYASDCGSVVCFQNGAGGLRAVEPGTGRLRWTSDRWVAVWPLAGRLVASTLSNAGPGVEQLAVLDPASGRVLAELGRWELARFASEEPVVVVRRHPDGGLLVAELDIRAGAVRMLDVLPDAAGECQSGHGRLLCRRFDGSYGLWTLNR
ncbi:PQQ-binding-like beta-propeller repeat protein [Micromonospora sp. GCM10011542]|uniref:outer membrane protein assembly factor BamB family protein n=1 Tax=Micromonospora sp. GCM10011542 TaxID=3317337 RepID=UPI0036123BFD